jgi:hypothetical protein
MEFLPSGVRRGVRAISHERARLATPRPACGVLLWGCQESRLRVASARVPLRISPDLWRCVLRNGGGLFTEGGQEFFWFECYIVSWVKSRRVVPDWQCQCPALS